MFVRSIALTRANNARREWARTALLAGWRHLRAQVLHEATVRPAARCMLSVEMPHVTPSCAAARRIAPIVDGVKASTARPP